MNNLRLSVLRVLLRGRLTTRERTYFNHRLSLFLRSGVPIVTALMYIAADARGQRARRMFSHITKQVSGGSTLASALGRHAQAFASFDIAVVRIGEASGRLHESLAYIAELIERQRALRARVFGALLYPGLILVATVGIVLFLILYAFPKILPLFRGITTTLPLPTRILIAVSDGVAAYGVIGAVLITVLIVVAVTADRQSSRVRLLRHHAQLRIPLIGSMLQAYQLSTITKVLSTLLKSGIGLVHALELAEAATTNTAYQGALAHARRQVLEGKRLSDTLFSYPVLFPKLASQIVGTGEITGNLSESLLQVATIYEDEVRERSQQLAMLVEPVLMIVTGIIVGFIALAIITPIYSVTQDLAH